MSSGVIALVISLVLAGVRIYEFADERRSKLRILSSLTSLSEIGNTITLLNASKTPINIWSYGLAWVKPTIFSRYLAFCRKPEEEMSPFDYDGCNITVEPHSQSSITFADADHFDWGSKLKYDIYLKLWTVGRRSPVWFFVTGPK
jgi:hypothetical protein